MRSRVLRTLTPRVLDASDGSILNCIISEVLYLQLRFTDSGADSA